MFSKNGDLDHENSFNLEDSIHDVSFTFSEPDNLPTSINLDISNGSPLDKQCFIGAHYNINSITAPGRLETLDSVAKTLNLSYLIINESKLDETIPTNLICLSQFHEPVRRDRTRHGGGCLVYISNKLTFKQHSELQSEFFEHIWIDVRVKTKVYSINSLYRPPIEDAEAHNLFLQEIDRVLLSMSKHKSDNFILASDLNFGNIYCKFPALSPKPLDNTAPEIFATYGVSQLIDIPTRVTQNCTSLIDLIYCKNVDNIQCHGTLPPIADHDGTFVAFHCALDKAKPVTKEIFDYKNLDETALLKYIKSYDFETAVFSKPITEQAEALTSVLTTAFQQFVPSKTIIIRVTDQPWVNSYTRLLLRKKNRNYQFFKKVNNSYLHALSKHGVHSEVVTRLFEKQNKAHSKSNIASQESTSANRRAKQSFFDTVTSTMHNYHISAKKKFSILTKLMKNNKISRIPPIIENGQVITDPQQKADIFNNFFASKSSVKNAQDPAPDLPPRNDIFEKLDSINTSPIEVAKLCRDIKKSCSSHCGVPGKFLALIATPISFPLYRMFNNIFEIGHFPDIFKVGHITAIYKNSGLKSEKGNYRGIHLLPTLSKIAESVMHSRLLGHCISNNIISERQAAYIKGDSTTQQLLYIVNFIKSSWTKGNISQGCFLDVSAAFDKCWVNGMIAKLEQIKIEGNCLNLFHSYLLKRKICTVVDGLKSEICEIEAGVPQGSRLGPLLWIIYIQDIIEDLESECLLFADDTCIFASGEDPAITAEVLNRDLQKIGFWAKKWKVLFNAAKSKDLIFSRNKYLFNSPPLILDDCFINRVHQHRHLGLWLSSTLDWDKQIHATLLKANGKLAVLRSVKFLDRATLDLLYKLTIRSVLEYGMIVYFHSLTQTQLARLSRVQYRAARLCTGALPYTSQLKLEQDLGWPSLAKRADFLSLTVFHKISLNLTRPLIRKCMPSTKINTKNTRSSVPYNPFPYKHEFFSKTFFPYTTKLYNKLPHSIRKERDILEFKSRLKQYYNYKKVKHFSRGISKYANSLHTQLRLGRLYLSAHGFAINVNNSNLCICSRPEMTKYFFTCFLYQEEQKVLYEKV